MTTQYIPAKEAAQLIRKQLKAKFPGVKFSVKTDTTRSINIRYENGPTKSDVESVVDGFEGEGFDGMIDMGYYKDSWLMPDGSAEFAASSGTEGSMGSVPARKCEAPTPDATLVHFGTRFIFVERHISQEIREAEKAAVAKLYGVDKDEAKMQDYQRKFGYYWIETQVNQNLAARGL